MIGRDYWLAFSAFSGVGPVKFGALIKRFETAKNAWKANKKDLREVIGEKTSEKFDNFRNKFSIEEYLEKLKNKNVGFLTLLDDDYPKLLKETPRPPFVLYIAGPAKKISNFSPRGEAGKFQISNSNAPRILAVVGTRKITNYGREVTEFLVRELVNAGFTIVSGLAIGIDTVAHETALENDGQTIAVLGCGVDCCTPATNQGLYNSIIDGHGFIASEFPLSQIPTKGSFPSRNRIIAGLSLGVLVTEGAEDSGSLITADYAFKFGRKVFAVPGPITSSLSKGPHSLLEKGAKLVTNAQDILREFQMSNDKLQIANKVQKTKLQISKEEERILKILENEQLHIDEIVRRSGLDIAKVGSLLSIMEVKGYVRDFGGGVFGSVYL